MSATGGSDRVKLFAKYARLWAFIIMGTATAVGVFLIFCKYLFHLSTDSSNALAAMGESVIASVFIYIMVSLFLDPVRQRLQAEEITGYAIDVAHTQFQERFASSLPSAVFESADVPKPSFRVAFESLVKTSTRYDSKGGAAEFATFRLATGANKRVFRRLEIRLCIVDPRADDCLRGHAIMRLRERSATRSLVTVAEATAALRQSLFVSLVALYDIRSSLATTVFLHRDLPFFRCEMFDTGMFLTYNLDGGEYPENLQFSSTTRPYRAYRANLEITRRFASKVIYFNTQANRSVDTDLDFTALLTELGCQTPLAALRAARDERFREFRKALRKASISEAEIF